MIFETCNLYREPSNLNMGLGIGYCDIDCVKTICNGDVRYCEKKDALGNTLAQARERTNGPEISNSPGLNQREEMNKPSVLEEKRKQVLEEKRKRSSIPTEIPVDFQTIGDTKISAGIAINASETGLLIRTLTGMPEGTRLIINALFVKNFELVSFTVIAEIIWKNSYAAEGWQGYLYGVELHQMSEKDGFKRIFDMAQGPLPHDLGSEEADCNRQSWCDKPPWGQKSQFAMESESQISG